MTAKSIKYYYDTDPGVITVDGDPIGIVRGDKVLARIESKVAYDFTSNSKYWYVFIPARVDVEKAALFLLDQPYFLQGAPARQGEVVYVESGEVGSSERESTSTLIFTKRARVYVDSELSQVERQSLVNLAKERGIYFSIRDREYARACSMRQKPLGFIVHDSRDKDALVRDLAETLISFDCPVWYDEYTLRIGDSLRQSIEEGLKQAKKCILVLSPNFLSNDGWPRAEFDSVFTREILEKKSVILPIWHGVYAKDVYNYSPRLADKFALESSIGVEELAKRLSRAIKDND